MSSKLLGLVLIAVGVAAACSANKAPSTTNRNGGGATDGSGASGGLAPLNTGGNTTIDPGGNGANGGVPAIVLTDCSATTPCADPATICVKTDKGGSCSPKGNACTSDMQCMNDTYCCSGTCRIDGAADGVCVVGDTRPQNDACMTGIKQGVFAPSLACSWIGPAADDAFPPHNQVLTTPLVADLPDDSGTAAEIIFVASDSSMGAIQGDGTGGRIRILNGQTCKQDEV
ncbi:MAG TPA: hypothetical protein VGF76_19510, partial [Polyangiaceae bacterium]